MIPLSGFGWSYRSHSYPDRCCCLACEAGWGAAHKSKKWVMLTGCQYVARADNDGDSFRVHCSAKEFILRLYFVDAPERICVTRSVPTSRASTLARHSTRR